MKRMQALGHWKTGALAGLLGLALASSGLRADPSDDFALNGPGGGVGTLPSTKGRGLVGLPTGPFTAFGGAGSIGSTSAPAAVEPGLALRGPSEELDALIALAYSPDGSGWFELSAPAPDGLRTLTYHGQVVVLLERAVLLSSQVEVALAVGPEARGSLASVVSGGRRTVQVLTTGLVNLPVHDGVRAGLLESGLEIRMRSRQGAPLGGLWLSTEGRVVRLELSH